MVEVVSNGKKYSGKLLSIITFDVYDSDEPNCVLDYQYEVTLEDEETGAIIMVDVPRIRDLTFYET